MISGVLFIKKIFSFVFFEIPQKLVAKALGVPSNRIVVRVKRMGERPLMECLLPRSTIFTDLFYHNYQDHCKIGQLTVTFSLSF